MNTSDYIAITSIIVGGILTIISWFVSSYITKKNMNRKEIAYEMKMYPIISKKFLDKSNKLEVYFEDEILPEPTLLSVDIINTGNMAIEEPPIEISAVGATYMIPGYIEDIPDGYEDLWTLERADAEECRIILKHINPGQVVKARFFLDELPKDLPKFKCPMKDLAIKRVDLAMKENVIKIAAEMYSPWFIRIIKYLC